MYKGCLENNLLLFQFEDQNEWKKKFFFSFTFLMIVNYLKINHYD